MEHVRICVRWGLGVAAILLSPIILTYLIRLVIGIGVDIFDLFGETPFGLVLCGLLAFVLLRRVLRLSRAAEINYAPTSVSDTPAQRTRSVWPSRRQTRDATHR